MGDDLRPTSDFSKNEEKQLTEILQRWDAAGFTHTRPGEERSLGELFREAQPHLTEAEIDEFLLIVSVRDEPPKGEIQ